MNYGGEEMFLTNLANLIMRIPMLGAVDLKDLDGHAEWGWVYTLVTTINTILVPIMAIVAAAGTIWAIVLGVQMARADSTEKREEAKKRLIGLIVGIIIMIVLIVFFSAFFFTILNATVLKDVTL
jgi:heme/copper-type cytochrome/quinol oxidase subunit 2